MGRDHRPYPEETFADFFGVDLDARERERAALLDAIRSTSRAH